MQKYTTMLCPYEIKVFEEQFNELKMDGCGITPVEKFFRHNNIYYH